MKVALGSALQEVDNGLVLVGADKMNGRILFLFHREVDMNELMSPNTRTIQRIVWRRIVAAQRR